MVATLLITNAQHFDHWSDCSPGPGRDPDQKWLVLAALGLLLTILVVILVFGA